MQSPRHTRQSARKYRKMESLCVCGGFHLSSDHYRHTRLICMCISCQKIPLYQLKIYELCCALAICRLFFFFLFSFFTSNYAVIVYRIVCITHECPCIICIRFFFLFSNSHAIRPHVFWRDSIALASTHLIFFYCITCNTIR